MSVLTRVERKFFPLLSQILQLIYDPIPPFPYLFDMLLFKCRKIISFLFEFIDVRRDEREMKRSKFLSIFYLEEKERDKKKIILRGKNDKEFILF